MSGKSWQLLQVMDSRAPDADDSLTYLVSTASRYPCSADSPAAGLGSEGFWQALQHGSNLPTVVPATRWDIDRCWPEPPVPNMTHSFPTDLY